MDASGIEESLGRERARELRRLSTEQAMSSEPALAFGLESFRAALSDSSVGFPAAPWADSASGSSAFREPVPFPAAALGRPVAEMVLASTAVFAPVLHLFPRTRHSTESLP